MEEMGITDTPYIIVRHTDKPHPHCHIMFSRVDYDGKIIIGGAAVTPSFADEIGADGYSKDAADCVKLVGRLLK